MKVVFLDIDGVLNSFASVLTIGMSYPHEDHTKVKLDPVATGLLGEICKECELSIYVHSTWAAPKAGWDAAWFANLFSRFGVKAEVLLIVHADDLNRNDRIQQAIDHYKPEKFLIFDDDAICSHFGVNFMHIDNRDGLKWCHYEEALRRFDKRLPVILM